MNTLAEKPYLCSAYAEQRALEHNPCVLVHCGLCKYLNFVEQPFLSRNATVLGFNYRVIHVFFFSCFLCLSYHILSSHLFLLHEFIISDVLDLSHLLSFHNFFFYINMFNKVSSLGCQLDMIAF